MNQEKIEEYKQRLAIPIDGFRSPGTLFYTKKGTDSISVGYERIVIGERGPYIEFERFRIKFSNIYMPEHKIWKLQSKYKDVVDYFEWRTRVDYVKIYEQKKTVDYADYLIGKFYIDPCDLYLQDGTRVLIPKREKKNDKRK